VDIAFLRALMLANEKNLKRFCIVKKKGTTTLYFDLKETYNSLDSVNSESITGYVTYEGINHWYKWQNEQHFVSEDVSKNIELDIEDSSKWSSSIDENSFVSLVEHMQKQMAKGEYYLANLTRILVKENTFDPIYSAMISCLVHETPNRFFLRDNDDFLLGLSPERFIKIQDGIITTEPMKGTDTSQADLSSNQKELEENIMMSDLARSDLSQVCRPESIRVVEQNKFSEHPGIVQMSSVINGTLLNEMSIQKVLDTILPVSSVTGTPKPHVVKEISKLEPHQRGVYCGVYGWADTLNQECDLSVTIRSIESTEQESKIGVGSGITLLSDPQKEWDETILKATHLLKIVDAQEVSKTNSVFTSFLVKDGKIFCPSAHIQRLTSHANEAFGSNLNKNDVENEFIVWLKDLIEKEGHYIRARIDEDLSISFEYSPYDEYKNKVVVGISPFPKSNVKTSIKWNDRKIYLNSLVIADSMAKKTIDEALLIVDGKVTEATRANVFIRKGNQVITPSLSDTNLKGVGRTILAEELIKQDIFKFFEQDIYMNDLREADEIVITNSVRGPHKISCISSLLFDVDISFDESESELFDLASQVYDSSLVLISDYVSE